MRNATRALLRDLPMPSEAPPPPPPAIDAPPPPVQANLDGTTDAPQLTVRQQRAVAKAKKAGKSEADALAEVLAASNGAAAAADVEGKAPRASGCIVTMTIAENVEARCLKISFSAATPADVTLPRNGLGETEAALPDLMWLAHTRAGDALWSYREAIKIMGGTLAELEAAVPLMRKTASFLDKVIAVEEDDSFAAVAKHLAIHFQAGIVRFVPAEGEATECKRGAVYINAVRFGDAFLARVKPTLAIAA